MVAALLPAEPDAASAPAPSLPFATAFALALPASPDAAAGPEEEAAPRVPEAEGQGIGAAGNLNSESPKTERRPKAEGRRPLSASPRTELVGRASPRAVPTPGPGSRVRSRHPPGSGHERLALEGAEFLLLLEMGGGGTTAAGSSACARHSAREAVQYALGRSGLAGSEV